jgi:hypothetical protein
VWHHNTAAQQLWQHSTQQQQPQHRKMQAIFARHWPECGTAPALDAAAASAPVVRLGVVQQPPHSTSQSIPAFKHSGTSHCQLLVF